MSQQPHVTLRTTQALPALPDAMTTLTIAAAQTTSIAGDIQANIARHLRFMQTAADHGVQFLVFPELSLTGYERTLARALAIRPDDAVLHPLREFAQHSGMIAVVGIPVRADNGAGVYIGALVLQTNGEIGAYTKQHLHPGEEAAFVPGRGGQAVNVAGHQAALAICAEITQPDHARMAAQAGAGIYAAGMLLTEAGHAPETGLLAGYAADHDMAVLMANHGGATGGWEAVGRSAIWAEGGRAVVAAPGPGNVLVKATREAGRWSGQVVPVPGALPAA